MNTAQPIREKEELEQFMNYYRASEPNPRNQTLIVMGVNTALRISDLLSLTWKDVYGETGGQVREHMELVEQKTGKYSCLLLNERIRASLTAYRSDAVQALGENLNPDTPLFIGKAGAPLSRAQAYRIVRRAAKACGIEGVISPHSLRKTFGYHAWKQGTPPVLLMEIYHHSSFDITKRYLGIEQDDRDEVFRNVCL